ncbi:hypothetical protein B0H11DRAFT_2246018 [Mycena galericulata]|nr:hypothetical protein B0H11DRAFT_2246018 [Mycena galericulata]
MFSSFAVLLATAAVAHAASSSSPSATASTPASTAATTSPYIPSSISSGCQTYLETLDKDTTLAPCTAALLSASSAYGPSGSASTSGASKATLNSALDTVCAASTASCSQSLLTGELAKFYTNCAAELTSSPNAQVKTLYDTIYGLQPFLAAVCTKDDSGNYCATESNATTGLAAPDVAVPVSSSSPARRDTATAYMPNTTTIAAHNLMFLALDPSAPKASLCTPCTRGVLAAYIAFETNTNYAPGLPQSVLLSGQPALYEGVVATCGADFLTSTVQAAGGLGQSGVGAASAGSRVRVGAGVLGAGLVGALAALVL